MPSRYTKEEISDAICKVLDNGESCLSVARSMNCSEQLVSSWVRKYVDLWYDEGIRYGVIKKEYEAVKRVVINGESVSSVARDLDVHPKVLFGWLKDYRNTDYDTLGVEFSKQIKDKIIEEYRESQSSYDSSDKKSDVTDNDEVSIDEQIRLVSDDILIIPCKKQELSGVSRDDFFKLAINIYVDELDLSVRAIHVLRRAGVNYVADAIKIPSLLKLRNCGYVCAMEILKAFRSIGCYVVAWENECKTSSSSYALKSYSYQGVMPVKYCSNNNETEYKMSYIPGVELVSCEDQKKNGRTLDEQLNFWLKRPLFDMNLSLSAIRCLRHGDRNSMTNGIDIYYVEDVLTNTPSLMLISGCGEKRQREIIKGFREIGIRVSQWEKEFLVRYHHLSE